VVLPVESNLAALFRMDKSWVKPAANMFSRAFQNYSLLQYYFPDVVQRERISPLFFSIPLYLGVRYGEVYAISSYLEGAAVWVSSGRYNVSFASLIRAVPLTVLLKFGLYGGYKIQAAGDYIDTVHKRSAPFKHWYLWLLGVDPAFQGKGYSTRLLQPMLARMDVQGVPCYVDTLDEVNVAIYEHFGFKLIEKSPVPGTSLVVWAMLREPAALK